MDTDTAVANALRDKFEEMLDPTMLDCRHTDTKGLTCAPLGPASGKHQLCVTLTLIVAGHPSNCARKPGLCAESIA